MKIGEEIIILKDTLIESTPGGNVLKVKAGDKAIETKMGLKYITGDAKGKINISDKFKIKGYDVDNISKRIVKTLIDNFSDMFEDYLEDFDISKEDLEEIVYDELIQYI